VRGWEWVFELVFVFVGASVLLMFVRPLFRALLLVRVPALALVHGPVRALVPVVELVFVLVLVLVVVPVLLVLLLVL
jgi:hypothetical protein